MKRLILLSVTAPFAALTTVMAARHGLDATLAAAPCIAEGSLTLSLTLLLGGTLGHALHTTRVDGQPTSATAHPA